MTIQLNHDSEWLETDGLGGFASGTVSGRRTRRYHALLLAATTPPTGRFVLVNGCEAWVETLSGRFALSTQHYSPNVLHPDGEKRLVAFESEPWPQWTFQLDDGTLIDQEILIEHGTTRVVIRWRLRELKEKVTLAVRPFFSGRDYHSLHRENSAFRFEPRIEGDQLSWRPYDGVPATVITSNAKYTHEPLWYRNFYYAEEDARGLDCIEDLASPGVFHFDLAAGEAVWILEALPAYAAADQTATSVNNAARIVSHEYQRRTTFPSRVHRSADAYLVRRGAGETIVAGYPWFSDWGRDTFVALRGLCLATGRLEDARDILLAWSGAVSEGMLPNRFPDHGEMPEFNSVDASLWYVVAVHEYLTASGRRENGLDDDIRAQLQLAVQQIIAGYARGTRFGIRMENDGLLAAGAVGTQLTWMDSKIGDWVVTPRIGKPVEVQALWLNALRIVAEFCPEWNETWKRGRAAFEERFWNESTGYLFDVVDCDHQPGKVDSTLRPNQILAVGGLPYALLDGDKARRIVDVAEQSLLTPVGLRSLAPAANGYVHQYSGGVRERDSSYHQGTVWPWLLGPFVEAWVRVRGNTAAAKRAARERFVEPLLAHLDESGIGHISEIADAEPPHTPRGCPFQAWSLGELLRLEHTVFADNADSHPQHNLVLDADAANRAVVNGIIESPEVGIERMLAESIQQGTAGRVRGLDIQSGPDHIAIHGQAPSYYIKQLAMSACQRAIPAAATHSIHCQIRVD